MATKNDISLLLNTTRYHISVRDTRGPLPFPCSLSPESGTHMGNPHETHMGNPHETHMGNPHETHMKQVDKNCMEPICVELWARSVETVC